MTENVKKLAHQLIEWGVLHGAQDVYFLPNDTEIAISFRTGMQRTLYTQVSAEIGEKLIFHFKFIGGMDVGERRKAQLGATTYLIGETKQRLRLSSVGDFQNRESLVIRFLHRFGEQAEHFFFPHQLNEIEASCQKRGLYLFSGPVGSGKQQPCIVWLNKEVANNK